MLRRCVSAALVLFVIGGFVVAGTYRGVITSYKDKKIEVTVFKKKGEDPEKMTFKVSKDVQIYKSKGKDAEPEKSSIEDLSKAVEKASKGKGKMKGVFATIETEGEGDKEKATKITTFSFGGKKKKDS
jgi:hypothetical protein